MYPALLEFPVLSSGQATMICVETGLCIVIPNPYKIKAENTSYFEIGGHVECPHSRSESM